MNKDTYELLKARKEALYETLRFYENAIERHEAIMEQNRRFLETYQAILVNARAEYDDVFRKIIKYETRHSDKNEL